MLALAGLAMLIVGAIGWWAAAVLDAATSREMEFRADADAARMLSDSSGLVGAPIKVVVHAGTPDQARRTAEFQNSDYSAQAVRRVF